MKNGVPQFAIVLSGCGVYDGSEIHEATCAMLAIDEIGCAYECFAPNIDQAKVLDHFSGDELTSQTRNVLSESARIARGKIKDLKEFQAKDFDAIIFPGGFGAVTNLCNYASKGVECDVDPEVRRVIEESYNEKIIIGAMCIAPVLIAKVLGSHGIMVTIGDDPKTAKDIEAMGAVHEQKDAVEVCSDDLHKILTMPAYMLAESIREVGIGARNLIDDAIELMELYGAHVSHPDQYASEQHPHDHDCHCHHDPDPVHHCGCKNHDHEHTHAPHTEHDHEHHCGCGGHCKHH